jgi:hypothetical protein
MALVVMMPVDAVASTAIVIGKGMDRVFVRRCTGGDIHRR